MRIHDPNLTGASAAASGAPETQRSGGARGAAAANGIRADRVEISGAVGSIARALTSNAADRAGRVRELTAQYQGGRFQPDPVATSRAIIADALAPA